MDIFTPCWDSENDKSTDIIQSPAAKNTNEHVGSLKDQDAVYYLEKKIPGFEEKLYEIDHILKQIDGRSLGIEEFGSYLSMLHGHVSYLAKKIEFKATKMLLESIEYIQNRYPQFMESQLRVTNEIIAGRAFSDWIEYRSLHKLDDMKRNLNELGQLMESPENEISDLIKEEALVIKPL